ncbi:MAG: PAS domain S-box protein [Polyangiaceae bacterium]|nr:PAS domain S-box protein [Polyangiaceae bacterium]
MLTTRDDRLVAENADLRRRLAEAEATIAVRVRQQQALANIGMSAIHEQDLQTLFDKAVETLANTLDVPLCKVLELLPGDTNVLLRAGVGWRDGLLGEATVSTGLDSQAGYTLWVGEPVIVEDLRTETRFSGPPLLRDHGVVSGLSCIIAGSKTRAWGVLGAHSTSLRHFTQDDVAFVQGVANVLAAAIQRHQGTEQLRISEARFSGLIHSAMDAVIAVNDEQRIELFNPAAEQMFGYSVCEAIGMPLSRLIPERFRAAHHEHVKRFNRTGQTPRRMSALGELSALRKNGEEFPIEASIARSEVAGQKLSTVVLRDISERKAAEEKLRASENFYRQTLESIPGMTFTNTPDGICDYVGEQWVEFSGVPASELLGSGWANILHPDDRERVVSTWRAAVETFDDDYDAEYRVRRRDGEYEWFKLRARAIRDESGRIARWFGTGISINNLKKAEEALKEADQRKDEFLAMLSHELRNPLAPILNAVQILRLLGPKEPKLERARDMIERQVNHLSRLVDDLLDVSRVSRGKIKLQKTRLDLADVIRQAVETSRPLIDARHHELRVTLPGKPICVEADLTRLAQVVSNLLNNAAKYTDDGGIIELAAEQHGEFKRGEAIIRVRDNGRGIESKALGKLFDMFYQVDRNLDRSEGGLGIGLSLVRSLVDMHGGRVEAHSDGRGKGSEFVVRLPELCDDSPSEDADDEGGKVKPQGGLRILVVDDNSDSAETMAMLLEIDGHELFVAHDGKKAVEVALAERPAVVLLDIGLPYLNGYQACRAMREGGLTDALVVAMTGYGQDDDRRMSEEAGFDAHLVKPVELPTVRELLAHRTLRTK